MRLIRCAFTDALSFRGNFSGLEALRQRERVPVVISELLFLEKFLESFLYLWKIRFTVFLWKVLVSFSPEFAVKCCVVMLRPVCPVCLFTKQGIFLSFQIPSRSLTDSKFRRQNALHSLPGNIQRTDHQHCFQIGQHQINLSGKTSSLGVVLSRTTFPRFKTSESTSTILPSLEQSHTECKPVGWLFLFPQFLYF